MHKLKIRKIGNSLGVILPKAVLDRLKLGEGESVILTEEPGGLRVTPYDPDIEDGMKAFERTRRKYRNAFRELAK